jgi:hypothetical protein
MGGIFLGGARSDPNQLTGAALVGFYLMLVQLYQTRRAGGKSQAKISKRIFYNSTIRVTPPAKTTRLQTAEMP